MQSKKQKYLGLLTLKRIIPFLIPHKYSILVVIAALIITASSVLVLGYGLKFIVDNSFVTNKVRVVDMFLLLGAGILLLASASYVRASTIYTVCENVEMHIRQKVYCHILRLSPEFYEINKTSDVISRLTVDTAIINTIIANLLSFLLRNCLMFFGGVIMLILISVKLALIVVAVVPISVFPILLLSKRVRKLSRNSQDMTALVTAQIDESLNAIKTLQSSVAEEYEITKFADIVTKTFMISKKRYKARAMLSSLVILIAFSSIAIVLYTGINEVLSQNMSSGDLSSFIFYTIVVAASLGGVAEVISELQRAGAATERIFELLDQRPIVKNTGKINISPNYFMPNIEFNKVSFTYAARPTHNVLHNISFTINEGEKVAIIGQSGCGKSTILNLLLRFYNINSGSIKIGDIDITEFSLKYLRNLFALVPQDPVIFSTSVFENIKYGTENVSQEDVLQAAKDAEIFDFINNLPQGFSTFLGEKGVRISGGQKQRICVARALLKKPKILLLDEATSALDSENERMVQLTLDKIKGNVTIIVIAHKISTIANADKIILLDNGKISDIGSYNDLTKRSQLFQKLSNIM